MSPELNQLRDELTKNNTYETSQLRGIIADLIKDKKVQKLLLYCVQEGILQEFLQKTEFDHFFIITSKRKLMEDCLIDEPNAEKAISYCRFLSETQLQSFIEISTTVNQNDGEWIDQYGVIYSVDRKKLINGSDFSGTSYDVKSGTEVICDEAFEYCSTLSSITLQDSIVKIGHHSFSCCTNLVAIKLSSNLISIGYGAFFAANLLSIEIPERVKTIESCVFSGCQNLRTVSLPSRLICIEENAFYNCNSLSVISIPNSMEIIEEEAFVLCKNIKEITLSNNISSIGYNAFWYCDNLKINIQKNNDSIKKLLRNSRFQGEIVEL